MTHITIEQAKDMGAKGAQPTEEERLLFEAWMAGHCWMVEGDWDGETYVHPAEKLTRQVWPGAMRTRMLWAAWRDRAALAAPVQEPVAKYSDIVSDGGFDPRNKFDLPTTGQQWAVFCGGCRTEWSVPYQHPGKSICAECEAKCKATPPAAQPAPVQEPKMYEDWYDSRSCGHCGMVNGHAPECRHNYKPPAAQRPFVGLMDEEIIKAMPGGIYDCLNDPWDCGVGDGDTLRSIKKDVLRIARAIEAKLREKNT